MALAGRPWAFGSDPPTGSGRVGLGGRYRSRVSIRSNQGKRKLF